MADAIRHDWYQNDQYVIVTVYAKGMTEDTTTIRFQRTSVSIVLQLGAGREWMLELDPLTHGIVAEESSVRILGTKVEIKLKKEVLGLKWQALQGEEQLPAVSMQSSGGGAGAKYPSSAKKTNDWDKLESEVKKEEAEEKPQGEDALNKLLQDIYKNATEDVKRAMNKSYVESSGTVLSTNWSEIGKEQTKVQPPTGMEAKAWKED